MKKTVFRLLFVLTICIMAGCATMPVSSVSEESVVGERSNVGVTEDVESDVTETPEVTEEPVVTEVPEAIATPKPTATPEPTATPKLTPTQEPVIDRNVVERDVYAVNGKNGKIHKTGECSATGDGKNAMTNPVYFPTYEEAEAYSKKIEPKLDKRKCGNCWR